MTNPIIENVRRSLGRKPETPLDVRPAIVPARKPLDNDGEIDLLINEINKLSGSALRVHENEISDTLQQLIAEQGIKKATLWDTEYLRYLKVAEYLKELGVELVPAQSGKVALAECDLGITEADFALAETGTIGLLASADKPRAVSLLPRVHLAIFAPEALCADLEQVFIEAKKSPYLVFITGPSRTADIELTVTFGVHGPKALYAWVVV